MFEMTRLCALIIWNWLSCVLQKKMHESEPQIFKALSLAIFGVCLMNYLIYLCISLFQSCFNSANFKCQLAPYTFLPLPWHFKIRKLKAILEYPIINKCRYFEITYLVATLIYKARGISSCSLRVPIHHKVLKWHWLVHGYWCLSSYVCLTMDFWTSYNNFITCFHQSWI